MIWSGFDVACEQVQATREKLGRCKLVGGSACDNVNYRLVISVIVVLNK